MFRSQPRGFPIETLGRNCCVLGALSIAILFGVAIAVKPDPRGYGTHQRLGLPPCGFYVVFKVPCPSCGGTTSFAHFVRGEWGSSMKANPAAFLFALALVLAGPWLAWSAAIGRLWRIDEPFNVFAAIVIGLAAVAAVHWGARIGGLAAITGIHPAGPSL